MGLNIFLNDFIERFNNKDIVKQTIFTELYDEYIIPTSKLLKNEINENMLTQHISDRENYLNYVKNRIVDEIISHCDKSVMDKWLKIFKLNIDEFPFVDNDTIKIKLSTWHNQLGLDYKSKKDLLKLQKDFFLHSFYLESCKIIKIIDDYLLQISISPSAVEKNELKYFKIKAGHSKKQKALNLFNALVTHNCIDANSKEDFVNAFIGKPPSGKINWVGSIGDLNILINHSLEAEFIEKVNYQWVYAENMFLLNGSDFTRQKIKDAHITKNKTEIIKIINSIMYLLPILIFFKFF